MFTLFWLALVTGSLIYNSKHLPQDYKDSRFLRKNLRPRHFAAGLLSVFSVMLVTTLLYMYIPPLRFGWLTWLAAQGSETQTGQTVESSSAMWIGIIVMLLAFSVFLPKLAYIEEEIFRKPYIWKSAKTQALQSLKFGLIHLTMGIPIAAALALSTSGALFATVATKTAHKTKEPLMQAVTQLPEEYKNENNIDHETITKAAEENGILESALVHTAHNYLIVTLLLTSATITVLT